MKLRPPTRNRTPPGAMPRRVSPVHHAKCELTCDGWDPATRRVLQTIISRGAGRRLPAIFDFDNTIVCGDVGEAVLALLAAEGRLTPANLCPHLSPTLRRAGAKIDLAGCADIMEYYEAFLAPTIHGPEDPAPFANGYVWATQVLEGLSVREVIQATAAAYRRGVPGGSARIELTPGGASYPVPRFRPEMIELISELLRLDYELWIVSASNVWSVRWMVVHGLNPLLAQRGVQLFPPEQVLGLATLLRDSHGRLQKDCVLAREKSGYAALRTGALSSLFVTRHLQFPVPVYSGKVACILDAIGRNPYLCAGDSPSDHPMMQISQHRLWIARPDKHEALRMTQRLMRRAGNQGWMLQSCLANGEPGFCHNTTRHRDRPEGATTRDSKTFQL